MKEADRIRGAGDESVQVSVYSHRPEVHDAITKLPGSLKKSIEGASCSERGVKVIIANVLMRQNFDDYPGVRALAAEVGAEYTIDPTITPMMDGDRDLNLGIERAELYQVFRNAALLGKRGGILRAADRTAGRRGRDGYVPCSASHTSCYISPYGDVYPCVQFPLPTGNVRKTKVHRYLAILAADE